MSSFRLVEGWGWDALPDTYKRSTHLCADSTALSEQHKVPQSTTDESVANQSTSSISEDSARDVLPTKRYISACTI